MLRCEAIGDYHINIATRVIAEIKECMRVVTEKIAQGKVAEGMITSTATTNGKEISNFLFNEHVQQ